MQPAEKTAIRPATADESACLSALALRSKAYWGYSTDFIEACRKELTFDSAYVSANTVFVADSGGALIGFYSLKRVSAAEAELGALFVEPDHIGRGFGRALMTHAKETACDLGITAIVIQGDPNAAYFYQAAGGIHCGELASRSIPGRVLPLFRIRL